MPFIVLLILFIFCAPIIKFALKQRVVGFILTIIFLGMFFFLFFGVPYR